MIVTVGEKLVHGVVDVNSHLFLLRVVFGDDSHGHRRAAFLKALPLLFYVISNDPEPASRATAIRAVVNEAQDKENNLNHILSYGTAF